MTRVRKALGQCRHGVIVLAGEDTVHEDNYRAFVRLRAESFRQANLEGYSALRAADFVVLGFKSE